MKHISGILRERENKLAGQRAAVFFERREKGSSEWSAFQAVREDRGAGYNVRLPKKPIVVAEPRHVLRIIYPYRRLHGAH